MIPQTTAPGDPYTRLHGRSLILARLGWLAIVLLTTGLYLLGHAITVGKGQPLCTGVPCDPSQLTPKGVLELQQLGLPANFLDVYFTLTNLVFVLGYLIVAIVIFWRRSDDWMALLGSLMLVTFSIATFSGSLDSVVANYPALNPVTGIINLIGSISLLLFFYLFPNGRFEPRWTRWILVLMFGLGAVGASFPNSPFGKDGPGVFLPIGSILFVQIFRYWKVSGIVERQQTKWVVLGTTAALGGLLGLILLLSLSGLNAEGSRMPSVVVGMVVNAAFNTFLLLIPLSLAIAILRYRLWEIDVLINRTLVYLPLTGIIAGLFAASITLSQKLFVALTGQQSDAATVLTTLIVVAAFDPIKNGLQHLVDRRFKEPSDPSKELHAMRDQANSLLQVIDIEASTRHLLDAAVRAFDATGGAVFLQQNGQARLVYTRGEWNGEAGLRVPLESPKGGTAFGELALGTRKNGTDYSEEDRAALQEAVAPVARALALIKQIDGVGK